MTNIELPLLTPAVIRTSRLSHEGASPPPPPADQGFVASVKSQTPPASSGQPWQLQLDVGGRALTVQSERPLPPGSVLLLTLSQDDPPLLDVKAVQLPSEKPSASLLNQPLNLEQRLQAAAQQLRQSASLPVAVRELLAARLPFYSQDAGKTPASQATSNGPTQQAQLSATQLNSANAAGVQSPARSAGAATSPIAAPPSLLSLLQPQAANRKVGAYTEMAAYRPPQAGNPVSQGVNTQQSSLPVPSAGSGADRLLTLLTQSRTLPAEVAQQLQDFVSRLPAKGELSQPQTLQQQVHNNPLNFEKQALDHVMSKLLPAGERLQQNTSSGAARESLSHAFRHFWQGATGTAVAQKMENAPLQSVINQLISASAETEKSATGVHSLPGSQPLHQPLPEGLRDNLKGLLLLISRHLTQTGNAAANSASAAQTDGQAILQAETFRLLHSVLARTEQEQVRLVQQADPYPATIPLLFRDGAEIRQVSIDINRDEGGETSDKQKKTVRWHLTLHFDLDQLGPLDVELELMAPGVSARFWSETTDTLSLLNTSLQPLRQRLAGMGAEVGELEVRHGRKLPEDQQLTIRHSLVDVRT